MGSLLELKWGDKFLTEFFAFHTIMGGANLEKVRAPPLWCANMTISVKNLHPIWAHLEMKWGVNCRPPTFETIDVQEWGGEFIYFQNAAPPPINGGVVHTME